MSGIDMSGIDMSIDKMPAEFEILWKQAEELVRSDLSARQAIAVKTFGGRIYCFANHDIVSGSSVDEEGFIRNLRESGDTQIQYALCIWDDSTLDVPSYRLRKLLVELNPLNQEAELILRSDERFVIKAMKVLL